MNRPLMAYCPRCKKRMLVERSYSALIPTLISPDDLKPDLESPIEVDTCDPLTNCGEFRCHTCGETSAETREALWKLIDEEGK